MSSDEQRRKAHEEMVEEVNDKEEQAAQEAAQGAGAEEATGEAGNSGAGEEANAEAPGEQDEVNQVKELLQRERAEFQNFKRRTANELLQVKQRTVSDFVSQFATVFDNLELVLGQQGGDLDSFLKGVELIRKEFLSVLEKYNIEVVDPSGEKFDPVHMEAFQMDESDDVETDTVTMVFQKGFVAKKEGDEVQTIRPARVKVTRPAKKAPAAQKDGEAEEGGVDAEA